MPLAKQHNSKCTKQNKANTNIMKRYVKSLLTCLMAGVLVQAAVTAARADALYPSTVMADGPVAYWRFSDAPLMAPSPLVATNLGSVGTATDGTIAGSFTRGVAAAMAGSTATLFTGGYITAPYDAGLNPAGAFTIEAWLKPSATFAAGSGTVTCALASMHVASPRTGWLIYQSESGWDFRMYNGVDTSTTLDIVGGGQPIAGTWYHLVVSYNGTSATMYVNGVSAVSGSPAAFVQNSDSVFAIGARSDTAYAWAGTQDDVAFYPSALSASDAAAHYAAATTNAAGYVSQVLASSPAGYWRLNEPSNVSVAANSGSAGASLNGIYQAGTYYAAAGPQPSLESGFETTNVAVQLANNPVTAPALMLNTNTVTFEAWVNPNAAENNFNGILFARSGGTTFGIQYGQANTLTYGWIGDGWDYDSGLTPPLDQWSYVAVAIYPDRSVVYMYDGTTWGSSTAMRVNAVSQITQPTFIGYDGYDGRYFGGSIDEPAVYGKTLTEGQLRTHALAGFDNAAAPLFVYDPPVAAPSTIYVTKPFTVTSDAYGTPPLSFQWRLNGTNIAGATSAIFAKASSALTDSGNYDVVVTNSSGSITSSVVAVTINAATAATIAQAPAPRQIYAGGRATFSVVAGGTPPFTYQWKHAGTNLPGATAATLVVSNVSAPAAGAYAVAVSNLVDGTVSSPATLTIRTPTSPYESAVVATGPAAYWRLGETSGTIAADYMSSYDGANQGGVTVGQPGPQPVTDPGFETTNSAFGYGLPSQTDTGLFLLDNQTNFTLSCWVNMTTVSSLNCLMDQDQSVRLGFYLGNLTLQASVAPAASITTPASAVTDGQWHFVVATGTSNSISLYVDGVVQATATVDKSAGYGAGLHPFKIGGSLWATTGNDFVGSLDEVALFYRALSASEVAMLYSVGVYGTGTPPQIVQDPQPVTVYAGGSANFSVQAVGSLPLSYQWKSNNVPLAGATTATLVVPNVQGSYNGSLYSVTVTNTAGLMNSAGALLTIRTPNPGYESAAASAGPLAYWRLDEPVSSTTAYDYAGGHNGAIGADVQMDYPGPQPGDGFTVFETTNTGAFFTTGANNSAVVVPSMNYSNNTVTLTAWINPDPTMPDWAGLIFCRGSSGPFGLNYGGAGIPGGSSAGNLSYSMSGASDGYPWISGIMPPANQWSFVALVVQPTSVVLYMINTNGQTVATNPIPQANVGFLGNTYIGSDPYQLAGRAFNGYMDEVGIYPYAMTPTQVQNLYNGVVAPAPPQLTINAAGGKVVLTWNKGVLLQANDVTGPWTTNNTAVSPWTNTPSGPRTFYRAFTP
jgi:hypothetical protein